MSRGNARAQVFHSPSEYDEFIRLLGEAGAKHSVELFAFCLMPNHFHLIARFDESAQLSEMMQRLLTAHVARYQIRHESTGHIWQGRFRSFPIQENEYLLNALRYVLVNPCRANLVSSAWDWEWSSLQHDEFVAPWPVQPTGSLDSWLAEGRASPDDRLRLSMSRSAPYGDDTWRAEIAKTWGLEATLKPLGRPKGARRLEDEAAASTLT